MRASTKNLLLKPDREGLRCTRLGRRATDRRDLASGAHASADALRIAWIDPDIDHRLDSVELKAVVVTRRAEAPHGKVHGADRELHAAQVVHGRFVVVADPRRELLRLCFIAAS